MTNPRVLCIGEILFDLISDQPGVPYEQVTSWTAYPGGAPANVACALEKLGTHAGFVGCVGADGPGEELVNLLKSIGVSTTGVQRHTTAPTREIYVIRTAAGDRQFVGFGDRDTSEFADTQLQASQLPVDLFATADFLVLGTLELSYPTTAAALHHALDLADQHDVKIVLDVNWRPMFWPDPEAAKPIIRSLMPRIDFLKLSDEEASWLFDITDPGAIAYRLENVEGVLVTAGDKGCAYCLSEQEGTFPAYSVEVEETTGAGDGFLAGLIHQLCVGGIKRLRDPAHARQVVAYASAVGALTTTRPGAIAAQPTAAEVEAFLYLNPEQAHGG
ncbi:MAG: carbohydrate kinase [Synechococcales bacterium]|nr:carbohydrate kinase [Synechococcales bacterium]